jgi:hypothetical protein
MAKISKQNGRRRQSFCLQGHFALERRIENVNHVILGIPFD